MNEVHGRFIMAGTFHKGDVWLDAIMITPWPTGTVMNADQREVAGVVSEALARSISRHCANAEDGDYAIEQCWLNVPRHKWKACPDRDHLKPIAEKHLTIRLSVTADYDGRTEWISTTTH